MDSLNESIDSFLKHRKNPTSERAYFIQLICDTFFDDTYFKKILGQTRQFTVSEIRLIFEEAKSWQVNPQALFWKLVREKQKEVRKQISDGNT